MHKHSFYFINFKLEFRQNYILNNQELRFYIVLYFYFIILIKLIGYRINNKS